MYISTNISDKIKQLCKSKGVSVKKMLEDVGLGFNMMSCMKTSMPKADNLANIADYLDCSVDYLLGRTTDPESHKQKGPVLMVENEPRYLVRRAGRDGSFSEEYLTKEEIEKIKEEANALEEADF